MICFKRFYNENLYNYDRDDQQPDIGFLWDKDSVDSVIELGDESTIPGNNGTLVGKFVGLYRDVEGTQTRYIQNRKSGITKKFDSKLYIGYNVPHLDEIVMASPKGSANYYSRKNEPLLEPERRPFYSKNFLKKNPIYDKPFSLLSKDEYTKFIRLPVIDFKFKREASRHYNIIAYPESRSSNVKDVAEILKNRVGTSDAVIMPLDKVLVSRENPEYYSVTDDELFKLFEVNNIAEHIAPFIRQKAGEDITDQQIRDSVKDWLEEFTNSRLNKTISTASHTRPKSLKAIANNILRDYFKAPIISDDEAGPSGRLDRFTKSHLRIEDAIKRINPAINVPNVRRNPDIPVKPDKFVLFVDDNINTGDIYKQLNPIIDGMPKDTVVDFFFLIASSDYIN
jgi:hypothetical protein